MGKQWASNKTSSGEFTLVMHLVIDLQLNTGPECQAMDFTVHYIFFKT